MRRSTWFLLILIYTFQRVIDNIPVFSISGINLYIPWFEEKFNGLWNKVSEEIKNKNKRLLTLRKQMFGCQNTADNVSFVLGIPGSSRVMLAILVLYYPTTNVTQGYRNGCTRLTEGKWRWGNSEEIAKGYYVNG